MVSNLDSLKSKIDTLKNNYERDNLRAGAIQEETKEVAEQLKSNQKVNKKNKEIVSELEKLGSQNMRVL